MNSKGEINVGTFLVIFAGVIVALALYQSTIGYYGTTSTTYYQVNKTYTFPAAGSTIDLVGQELIDTPVVTNATGGALVATTNYTIAEGVSTLDGLKRIRLTAGASPYNALSVNVSYTYGPEGYIADAASRSVAGLIAIFAVLAIGIFVLFPVLREKLDF